jgi:allantoicase
MKTKLIFLSIASVFLITGCNSGGSSASQEQTRPRTPEELKAELKQQELNNPLSYLSDSEVTMKDNTILVSKETFFKSAKYKDDGKIVEGYIVNSATLAKYKDVVVKIAYYSSTKTLIEEKKFVFYEFYEPNSTNYFSLKVYPPSAYDTYGFTVVDAKPVYK